MLRHFVFVCLCIWLTAKTPFNFIDRRSKFETARVFFSSRMEQDTGKFRKNTKDQFYTKASVAKKCVDQILLYLPHAASYEWVEPSAGNGVFLRSLPTHFEKMGIDLDPKDPMIQKGDFLEWAPPVKQKRIFFGNPPFGRQGSLAKSFIKHAAKYGDIIAFILPRSFIKPSMSRAFPLLFHRVHSEELEKNAFEVNEEAYDVPCVFQIWEKKATERVLEEAVTEEGFQYVKHGEAFHIAFKRVGGQAGRCYAFDPTAEYNRQVYYFLKLEEAYVEHIQKIVDTVNAHVFPTNTAGPRSLSKSEANEVLNQVLSESC